MRSSIAFAAALAALLPAGVSAQTLHTTVTPDAVKWEPAPPFLPPGSQIAVLFGDPARKGLFIVRSKMPDGYAIPPHWHSRTENVTVLSGTFNVGMGKAADRSKGQALAAGGFFSAPARMPHFAWATGETVIEVSGMGPLDIRYIDPKDHPARSAKAR
jgi:quercetin dioxygenase-like cupin family protein